MPTFRNWGRTFVSHPTLIHKPTTEEELVGLVQGHLSAARPMRVAGAGHSFSPAVATDSVLVDGTGLTGVESVEGASVRFLSGTRLRDAATILQGHGLAFPNLGDIDVQTVAGAVNTATHGTGIRRQSISAAVNYVRLIDGQGQTHEVTPDHPWFGAVTAGLGTCGIHTCIGFELVEDFRLEVNVKPANVDDVLAGLEEHIEENDHFEFFWLPHTETAIVKTMNRTDAPTRGLRRRTIEDTLVSNVALSALCRVSRAVPSATPALAGFGSKFVSESTYVDHARSAFASTRLVRFAEMEYGVAIENARDAFNGVRRVIRENQLNVSFPIEVRFLGSDNVWMSPAYGRDSAFVACHMYRGVAWRPYFELVEEMMRDLGGRPHPGKINFRSAGDLRPVYPRFDDFCGAVRQIDPEQLFMNEYTGRLLGV